MRRMIGRLGCEGREGREMREGRWMGRDWKGKKIGFFNGWEEGEEEQKIDQKKRGLGRNRR